MRKLFTLSILILAGLLLSMQPAEAQVSPSTNATTLSGAVSSTQTFVCLASATGVTVPSLASGTIGSYLVVDKEAMQVTGSYAGSTTCFNVKRGVLGRKAVAHLSGAYTFVLAAAIGTGDPSRPTSTSEFMSVPGDVSIFAPYTEFLTPAGAVAGTAVADTNGDVYLGQINVPNSAIVTGACLKTGASTDKHIVALYDALGNLLGNSTTAGATDVTGQYVCQAFASPVVVRGPQVYYVATQGNGTTASSIYTYPTGSMPANYGAAVVTGGTFGTIPTSIAVPNTFTAAKGPVMMLY